MKLTKEELKTIKDYSDAAVDQIYELIDTEIFADLLDTLGIDRIEEEEKLDEVYSIYLKEIKKSF